MGKWRNAGRCSAWERQIWIYLCPCIREALIPIAQENCYNYRQHPQEYYDAVISWYRRCYGLK